MLGGKVGKAASLTYAVITHGNKASLFVFRKANYAANLVVFTKANGSDTSCASAHETDLTLGKASGKTAGGGNENITCALGLIDEEKLVALVQGDGADTVFSDVTEKL